MSQSLDFLAGGDTAAALMRMIGEASVGVAQSKANTTHDSL